MLAINGLTFGYKKQQHHIADVSLQLAAGGMLGLLGPNGAGKTTLVSLIIGQLTPRAGAVTMDGRPVYLGHPDIALVPQEYAFYPRLSAGENLDYFAGILGLAGAERRRRVGDALGRCELQSVKNLRSGQLSGGYKRRLNFAIALLQRPRLLILDEPTANVDPHSRAFLLDAVRDLNAGGTAIIYTSHLLDEVENLVDQVALMSRGRIILQGPLAHLLGEQQRRPGLTLPRGLEEVYLNCIAAENEVEEVV